MAQSQVVDWLNENEYRMYPLSEYSNRLSSLSYRLATNVVLDLNLYIPGYPLSDTVELLSIVVSGNTVTFTFTGNNVFAISDRTAITYPYYFPRAGNGSFLVVGQGVISIPTGAHTFTGLNVEPAVVFELSNAWSGVSEITVSPEFEYNSAGTPFYRALLPLTPQNSSTIFTGDITLYPGYNFGIQFEEQTINLSVVQNYGIPLTCDDEFIASGVKDCGKIISYINGVGPDATGNFTLTAGSNIVLYDGRAVDDFIDEIDTAVSNNVLANPHSLFVGLTFLTSDVCSPVIPLPQS